MEPPNYTTFVAKLKSVIGRRATLTSFSISNGYNAIVAEWLETDSLAISNVRKEGGRLIHMSEVWLVKANGERVRATGLKGVKHDARVFPVPDGEAVRIWFKEGSSTRSQIVPYFEDFSPTFYLPAEIIGGDVIGIAAVFSLSDENGVKFRDDEWDKVKHLEKLEAMKAHAEKMREIDMTKFEMELTIQLPAKKP